MSENTEKRTIYILDLSEVVFALDVFCNCNKRSCEECKNIFTLNECPQESAGDILLDVLKLIEKYRDNEWDKNHNRNNFIPAEDFIKLLQGELPC